MGFTFNDWYRTAYPKSRPLENQTDGAHEKACLAAWTDSYGIAVMKTVLLLTKMRRELKPGPTDTPAEETAMRKALGRAIVAVSEM